MSYHPDQRFISSLTTIRRHVMLPDEAAGSVTVKVGQRVDPRDTVIEGVVSAHHVILEAASVLGLKKPEGLRAMLFVDVGDIVEVKQPLAGKQPNRGKRVLSPIYGIVAQVADGRIILQEMPELLKLEAGVQGRVVEVRPGRGVVIETTGAVVQGVWGNDLRAMATLNLEPKDGLETIVSDVLEMQHTGTIILTQSTLTAKGLAIVQEQNFGGVIAPSMDASLREEALKIKVAILLTEGFGSARMSNLVYSVLSEFKNKQVILDAARPMRWGSRRPEVIISVATEQRPPGPNPMLALGPDVRVRVIRAPYLGLTGKIVDLPKTPCLMENGLRVPCAQVELLTGDKVVVPLADLEYYGK